jgi:hypothetical protein
MISVPFKYARRGTLLTNRFAADADAAFPSESTILYHPRPASIHSSAIGYPAWARLYQEMRRTNHERGISSFHCGCRMSRYLPFIDGFVTRFTLSTDFHRPG